VTLSWQEWKQRIGDKLHAFVDRALENSSVALYDQSLRDMEEYIAHVEEAAVSMMAASEGNKRHLTQHQAEADILDTRLNQLLREGQAEQAHRVQQALNVKQGQIVETQAQIERQSARHTALVHNWQMLKERLQVLQGERESIMALVALTRAERAIDDIEHTLGSLAGLGNDSEIGVMSAHILQRLDKAEAHLALVDVDAEVARAAAAIEAAQVEEQLAERRRRLGLVVEEEKATSNPPAAETRALPDKEGVAETTETQENTTPKAVPPKPEKDPSTTPEP